MEFKGGQECEDGFEGLDLERRAGGDEGGELISIGGVKVEEGAKC